MATTADRLRAQASGGQLGLAAYDEAQRTIASSRSEAAQAALQGASTRNAPAAAQTELDRIVSSPASYYTEAAGLGRQIMGENIGAAGAAQAAYLASVARSGSLGDANRAASSSSSSSGGSGGSDGPYNRYGGYESSGEYDNAAIGGALVLQGQGVDTQKGREKEAQGKAASARQAQQYLAQLNRQAAQNVPKRGVVPAMPTAPNMHAAQDAWLRSTDDRPMPVADDFAEQQRLAALIRQHTIAWNRDADEAAESLRVAGENQNERMSGLANTHQRTAQDALAEQAYLSSPQALQELRYQFATGVLGGDPMEARGRFAPTTEAEIMQNEIDQAELEDQYTALMLMPEGAGGGPETAARLFTEKTNGMDLNAVASDLNMDPMVLAAVTGMSSYDEAWEAVSNAPDVGSQVEAVLSVPNTAIAAILVEMLSLDPAFADAYDQRQQDLALGLG